MLERSFIIAFIVTFIWASMLKGNIFGFIRTKVFVALSDYWKKPVFDCNICMTPWYGTAVYWLIVLSGKWESDWKDWLICIFIAGGINTVLNKMFVNDIQKMFLVDKLEEK